MVCNVNRERKVLLKVSSITMYSGQVLPQRTEENGEKSESIVPVSDWIGKTRVTKVNQEQQLRESTFQKFR